MLVKPKLGNSCGSLRREVDAGGASRHAQSSFFSGGQKCRTLGSFLRWRRSSKRFGNRFHRLPEIIKRLSYISLNGPERLITNERSVKNRPSNASSEPLSNNAPTRSASGSSPSRRERVPFSCLILTKPDLARLMQRLFCGLDRL